MMIMTQLFYLSLTIFLVGLFLRIYRWFKLDIGPSDTHVPAGRRAKSVLCGLLKTVFGISAVKALIVFIADAVLQLRVIKQDFVRWLMHGLMFFGFIGLTLMHALDGQITEPLFSGYISTVNPFYFLRNLMGMMVLVGVALAVYRRVKINRLRMTTNHVDIIAIVILFVIIASGFALEGAQIISEPIFDDMAADYMGTDDPEEVAPLKAYWAANFGVMVDALEMDVDEQVLEEGLSLHEESCMQCHDRPQSAFVSYGLSRLFAPMASFFNDVRMDVMLWYLHFIACFAGLAYLPFSRLFHMIVSPLSLIVSAVSNPKETREQDTPAKATQRAMALDACTHCGACSTHCSVGPVFQLMGNEAILPSEKLLLTFSMAGNNQLKDQELSRLSDGSFICTDCYRCTSICPSGINLQDIWFAARRQLEKNGHPAPYLRLRRQNGHVIHAQSDEISAAIARTDADEMPWMAATAFATCFECQTCTNVCPVVACHPNPGEALKLLPHQIMHAVGLGLMDLAMGATMIWDCTTCYKCQEQCPQGVQVTEVLNTLKNLAWRKDAQSRSTSPEKATA